jgi:hypothetical protein
VDKARRQAVVVGSHRCLYGQGAGLACGKSRQSTFDRLMMSHLYGNVNIAAPVGVEMGGRTKFRAHHG